MMRKISVGLLGILMMAALLLGMFTMESRAAVTTVYVCHCQTGADATLVGAGHPTLSSGVDYAGNGRPIPPAAGAYEWRVLSPVLWLPWVE